MLAEESLNALQCEFVEQIQLAGERAATLTRQLLALGRRQFTEPRTIDLNEIVSQSESMMKRLIGENIAVTTDLFEQLPPIKADPGQIDQVLLNLVVNARDAMPKGGRLTIRTAVRIIDADDSNVDLQAGEYVEFSVIDTGVGIAPDVMSKIFEPFFSTKGIGKGTGLGLSTVYGIVKQNFGAILVESEEGRGATFRVLLPVDRSAPIPTATPTPHLQVTRGTGTILLAEDEHIVREIVLKALRAQGYAVLHADSGESALKLAEEHEGTIDMLITDVVMPGMSGTELAQRLRNLFRMSECFT